MWNKSENERSASHPKDTTALITRGEKLGERGSAEGQGKTPHGRQTKQEKEQMGQEKRR